MNTYIHIHIYLHIFIYTVMGNYFSANKSTEYPVVPLNLPTAKELFDSEYQKFRNSMINQIIQEYQVNGYYPINVHFGEYYPSELSIAAKNVRLCDFWYRFANELEENNYSIQGPINDTRYYRVYKLTFKEDNEEDEDEESDESDDNFGYRNMYDEYNKEVSESSEEEEESNNEKVEDNENRGLGVGIDKREENKENKETNKMSSDDEDMVII